MVCCDFGGKGELFIGGFLGIGLVLVDEGGAGGAVFEGGIWEGDIEFGGDEFGVGELFFGWLGHGWLRCS